MQSTRSSHIHHIRLVASTIFGHGFEQLWFMAKFERNSLEKFREQLGLTVHDGEKKYALFPPILFPNGLPDKNALFLNPALAGVCVFVPIMGPCTLYLYLNRY